MNPRKSEFVLTLIAGITGIIAGITGIAGGGLLAALSGSEELSNATAMTAADSEALAAAGGLTVIFSIIALVLGIALIVFAVLIKRNAKVFGILTLVAGVVGFFFNIFFCHFGLNIYFFKNFKLNGVNTIFLCFFCHFWW